jgi:ParE toxin of type II toxin-antitoxin system, parDE
LIEPKIHDLGLRLSGHSHHRPKGRSEYRLRAGDYRIIYEFDQEKNIPYLVTLGHRREIYRWARPLASIVSRLRCNRAAVITTSPATPPARECFRSSLGEDGPFAIAVR